MGTAWGIGTRAGRGSRPSGAVGIVSPAGSECRMSHLNRPQTVLDISYEHRRNNPNLNSGVVAVLACTKADVDELFETTASLARELERIMNGVTDPKYLGSGVLLHVFQEQVLENIGLSHGVVKAFGGISPRKMEDYYSAAQSNIGQVMVR